MQQAREFRRRCYVERYHSAFGGNKIYVMLWLF